MKPILLAGTVLALTALLSASAAIVEAHNAWGMTCYPADGPPFLVAASVSPNNLVIKGRERLRHNSIVNIRQFDHNGFTVTAQGADVHGLPRTIEAHFSSGGGYLDILDRGGDAIECGPDVAISND